MYQGNASGTSLRFDRRSNEKSLSRDGALPYDGTAAVMQSSIGCVVTVRLADALNVTVTHRSS
jgi:hypothetical protein